MSRLAIVALGFCMLAACDEWKPVDDGGHAISDLKCPSPPDMTVAPAKCAAAKGLSGDSLLCVDFNQVSGLSDSKLTGWYFEPMDANCIGGWTVSNGSLQVNLFPT